MARIDNLSLTRSLQADGWWYRVMDDMWSRMWDDEMQYGRIREGKFERVFPEGPIAIDGPTVRVEMPVAVNEATVRVEDSQVSAMQAAQKARDDAHKKRLEECHGTAIGQIDPEAVQWSNANDPQVWVEEQAEADALWPEYGLRDMFAMHALPLVFFSSDPKGTALRAYEYADAMMVAREMKK